MKKIVIVVVIYFSFVINLSAQLRSFNDIFPNISQDTRNAIFSGAGFLGSSQRARGISILGQNSGLNPQITNIVLNRNPGYIVEAISLIPGSPGSVSLLDIYNAIGNIRGLKGMLYDSHSKGEAIPLFEEATRLVSERQTTPIPDPSPARVLPQTETVYIRLKDVNFGNTFYRGEMAILQNGMRYTMTNFKSLSYLFVPVIREGNFIAQLYFEPINEGVLIYSIAGAEISDFFASRIHVDSAIAKRLGVITSWASNGIIAGRR